MASRPPSGSGSGRDDGTATRNVRMTSYGGVQIELDCRRRNAVDALGRAHFAQREQERERRFGALIAIHPIGMEPVATPAGRRVVQPLVERVTAEEPFEGTPRGVGPRSVASDAVCRETGRRGRARFDRLLI